MNILNILGLATSGQVNEAFERGFASGRAAAHNSSGHEHTVNTLRTEIELQHAQILALTPDANKHRARIAKGNEYDRKRRAMPKPVIEASGKRGARKPVAKKGAR